MVIWANEIDTVRVPEWVRDFHSFRRWTDDPHFPETGRIWWLKGETWVDMSKEQLFTHIRLKTVITTALDRIATDENLGIVFADGLLLSNFAADICGNPDATFVSNDTLQSDRVRLLEGREGGFTELQGSPDLVLQVVSRSSVQKDTVTLKQGYWEAGAREYWLVDARKEPLRFDLFRRGRSGFVAARRRDGWATSEVFGRSFRLAQTNNVAGHPEYRLEVR